MYLCRKPVEALRPWVAMLWYSRRDHVRHSHELALPHGAQSLTVRLDGEPIGICRDGVWQRFQDGVLWGAQSRFVVRDTTRLGPVVGVQFQHGMAAALLGGVASEWSGRHLEVSGGWMEEARNAGRPEEVFGVVEKYLMGLRPRPVDAGIAFAIRRIGDVESIEALRRECGYSAKRFIRGFEDTVGMSPKRYSRVLRFGVALRELQRGVSPNLAQLALDCGYCDQSHLNREFQAFAGITPGEYRPVRADWLHHVAVDPAKISKTSFQLED